MCTTSIRGYYNLDECDASFVSRTGHGQITTSKTVQWLLYCMTEIFRGSISFPPLLSHSDDSLRCCLLVCDCCCCPQYLVQHDGPLSVAGKTPVPAQAAGR